MRSSSEMFSVFRKIKEAEGRGEAAGGSVTLLHIGPISNNINAELINFLGVTRCKNTFEPEYILPGTMKSD